MVPGLKPGRARGPKGGRPVLLIVIECSNEGVTALHTFIRPNFRVLDGRMRFDPREVHPSPACANRPAKKVCSPSFAGD